MKRPRAGRELAVGFGEVFRVHTGFTDDGHEVRIAVPAGQDVHVDVSRNTGSGHRADVKAEVQSVAAVDGTNVSFGQPRKARKFNPFRLRQIFDPGDMTIGRDHHMAVGVGVEIEQAETVFGPEQDEGFWIVCGSQLMLVAKDAVGLGALLSGDVAVSPGAPEMIHETC